MYQRLLIIIVLVFLPFFSSVFAAEYYSTKICQTGEYDCIQVRNGETWSSLWPKMKERDLVKRFNRMNIKLKPGMYLAIPEDLEVDFMSIAPFKTKIDPPGSKLITVDLNQLAWAAYNGEGELINWGPASGGSKWCYDINMPGKTVTGRFEIYDVRGEDCTSRKFPVNEGGAPMPYCMFFQGGFALHGSDEVPGYNASHGCVRLFVEDAKWLNEEFVKTPGRTKVSVLPYEE